MANLPYSQMSTLGGIRTRSLRIESPASSPCLDHEGLELRRQASNLRLASNSRASYRLDYTGTKGGGSRTRTCERHEGPPAR
jgi:hypothetical protein